MSCIETISINRDTNDKSQLEEYHSKSENSENSEHSEHSEHSKKIFSKTSNKIDFDFSDEIINGYKEDSSSDGSWNNNIIIDEEDEELNTSEISKNDVTKKNIPRIITNFKSRISSSSDSDNFEISDETENYSNSFDGIEEKLKIDRLGELSYNNLKRLDGVTNGIYGTNSLPRNMLSTKISPSSASSPNISNKLLPSPLSKSNFNLRKIESFEAKLPKDISNEKKMSLLIVVLLQMVFNDNSTKLEKIYSLLAKKKLLDLEVTKINYTGIRRNLSFMIENLNTDKSEKVSEILESPKSKTKYINKYRNNFNQLNMIGKGGFGTVYKVFHKFEKKMYALKKIFIVKDLIAEGYDIFNEIQLYSEIIHPNIVRYYSSWVDIDLSSIMEYNKTLDLSEEEPISNICPILFIQMELCNMTMKEYFLTTCQDDSIETKIEYFKQILLGLDYLHSNGLLHRDLKPENIFLVLQGDKYIIKIGDFGLSKKNPHLLKIKNIKNPEYSELLGILDQGVEEAIINKFEGFPLTKVKSITNHVSTPKSTYDNTNPIEEEDIESDVFNDLVELSKDVGTGIYKAPEIITGNYDNGVDIYSVGIIFIEMLLSYRTNHEKVLKLREILTTISESQIGIITEIGIAEDEQKQNQTKYNPIPYITSNDYDNIIRNMLNPVYELRYSPRQILELLEKN